mmetsp:Transcript_20916/g.36001  ORF Transcript_20916/g.36001 Transcript_20916/m.36001 type:complete len:107 (+) Transcript_20916:192-512(+)
MDANGKEDRHQHNKHHANHGHANPVAVLTKDKHVSRTGMTHDGNLPKKGGMKGWGKIDETDGPAVVGENDPNYDEDQRAPPAPVETDANADPGEKAIPSKINVVQD